jgi:nitroreductase
MDLIEALRTTGAVRDFEDRPVDRSVVARVLDTARFAPNGGNQQSWHVVLVEDPAVKASMRDLYVPGWLEYLEMRKAGVQPWAPIGDPEGEAAAVERARQLSDEEAGAAAGGFAAHFDQVPVMAVILADLRLLAATDRDLGRYTLVGGASVYPFVWSTLLAAHAEGLGGVVTTMTTTREPEVRQLLRIPDEFAVAAVLALGYPVKRPKHLRRDPVASFATVDAFDGAPVVSD